jgi:hypothetical protein
MKEYMKTFKNKGRKMKRKKEIKTGQKKGIRNE